MATILPSHAATPDPRPGVTALFSEIGIQAQGRKKQFIVADNVDGYFDGQTGSYRANAGYWIGQERLFQDHAAWVNGRLIDRRAARSVETVFPYGREVHAVGGSDVFVLHPGSRRFSLRVSSAKNATLAIQPLWKDVPAETRWHDGVLLVTAAAGKLFAAISADQAFEIAAPGTTLAEGMPMERGDVLRIETPGGGGFGHPFDRDPELVLRDLLGDFISPESALTDYGVAIDPVRECVDLDATRSLRDKHRWPAGKVHRGHYYDEEGWYEASWSHKRST